VNVYYDPYDIWATRQLGKLKQGWGSGSLSSKVMLPVVGILELLTPVLFRRLIGVNEHHYPHVEAMLASTSQGQHAENLLSYFKNSRVNSGWGLPFAWYSKNGVYGSNIPYVTNTPYVMEALLKLSKRLNIHDEAMEIFQSTWGFLESLKVMFEGENLLALSYAPIDEPRMVVNANAYAAFGYALHAVYGKEQNQEIAKIKVERLTNWVIEQQNSDGSWLYYADNDSGNFIDCFHSCFVVKNLLKVSRLLPDLSDLIQPTIDKGWVYIRNELYDKDSGLCRRFASRAQRDPFRLDLYDQAEYLGLLVDFGLLSEAEEFAVRVEKKFRKGKHWYCRIDMFGRRWGKDFLRWGIVPFWYHQARLAKAVNAD